MKYIIISLLLASLTASVYAAPDKLPPEKCAECHSESLVFKQWKESGHARTLKILMEDPTASMSCLRCHSADYKSSQTNPWMSRSDLPTLRTATNPVSCSACHKHDSGFQDNLIMPVEKLCTTCHVLFCGGWPSDERHEHSQADMFAGTGGSGVKNMPSEHIKIMPKKCVTCHMHKEEEKQEEADEKADVKMQKGGHTFRSDDKACLKCHENPKLLVKEQNEKTAALLKRLKKLLDSTPDKKSASYRTARLNYNIVIADGEIGLHNPSYAQALLRHGISALTVESVWGE